MNTEEPIAEVRRYRQEHAEQFDYDIDKIVADIRKGEQKLIADGWRVTTRKRPPGTPMPPSRLKPKELKELRAHIMKLSRTTPEWRKAMAQKLRAVADGRFILIAAVEKDFIATKNTKTMSYEILLLQVLFTHWVKAVLESKMLQVIHFACFASLRENSNCGI